MRPDDRRGSRHSRHPPAFMSTRHRAHVAARVVSDAGTTPTTRTWQWHIGQPEGLSRFSISSLEQAPSQLAHQRLCTDRRSNTVARGRSAWLIRRARRHRQRVQYGGRPESCAAALDTLCVGTTPATATWQHKYGQPAGDRCFKKSSSDAPLSQCRQSSAPGRSQVQQGKRSRSDIVSSSSPCAPTG